MVVRIIMIIQMMKMVMIMVNDDKCNRNDHYDEGDGDMMMKMSLLYYKTACHFCLNFNML